MKRTTLLYLFVLLFFCAKAQWVNIPDSTFGKFLTANYPTCMLGNPQVGFTMDTTCSTIIAASSISINYSNVKNLDGIQYFKSLRSLDCSNCNQLSNIPRLPSTLYYLDCYNDAFSILPALAPFQKGLNCNHNQLSFLPFIPGSVQELDCSYNPNLFCLPNKLSSPMAKFYIAGTLISCVPNRFGKVSYDIDPNTLPLCDLFSGCFSSTNINGNVHQKTALTCTQDSLYSTIGLANIKLLLKKNGQIVQQAYSFNLGGTYAFDTDTNTSYIVALDTTGIPFLTACPVSGIRNVALSNTDSIKVNQNFGLECKGGKDIGVLGIVGRYRVGRTSTTRILISDIINKYYGSTCTSNISGAVNISYQGPVTYTSPAPDTFSSSVSGNTIS